MGVIEDELNATPATADEFQLAITEADRAEVERVLFEDERFIDYEERGVICTIRQSTGGRRVTYVVDEVLTPEDEHVNLKGGVAFESEYKREARQVVRGADSVGLLFLHTHYSGGDRLSEQDTDVAREELFREARKLGDDAPFGIGIVTEDERDWLVCSYEFDTPDTVDEADQPAYSAANGTPRYATAVRVVGQRLTKLATNADATGPAGAVGAADLEAHDSSSDLWGQAGQETLAALRVGIVGLGGGGSILTEHLARLGIGELVLIDFDRIDHANLNRAQGATRVDADVHRLKIDVAKRIANTSGTAPEFEVSERRASAYEDEPGLAALPDLLDCDVLFNAADHDAATRVLDEIAHAHLIPVVNGGTDLRIDDGKIGSYGSHQATIAGPNHACLRCQGFYTEDSADEAMERDDMSQAGQYNVEEALEDDDRAISMVSSNAVTTGLMQERFLDLVLGIADGHQGEMRFRPRVWETKNGISTCESGCDRDWLVGKADDARLDLGRDCDFKKMRDAENSFGGHQ